jgi:hypothetical protein
MDLINEPTTAPNTLLDSFDIPTSNQFFNQSDNTGALSGLVFESTPEELKKNESPLKADVDISKLTLEDEEGRKKK